MLCFECTRGLFVISPEENIHLAPPPFFSITWYFIYDSIKSSKDCDSVAHDESDEVSCFIEYCAIAISVHNRNTHQASFSDDTASNTKEKTKRLTGMLL